MGLQGISDAIAFAYVEQHGSVTWADIEAALEEQPSCPRLTSYWHFDACAYRKGNQTCSEPLHLPLCPLPRHTLRKGTLNQAAYSLYLFLRDVSDGDIVGWIDHRLREADPGPDVTHRGAVMRAALLEPLSNVRGTGPKLWSMILADLLLGADLSRERWVTTGAWMIAIDTLVHNFLHRTGILRRCGAEHPYGARCYGPDGCMSVIEMLAQHIDARAFNPAFPAVFPRFVQFAIWHFCAEGGLGICNGNQIDDWHRCENTICPAYDTCDRVSLAEKWGAGSRKRAMRQGQ
ncbi:hypothetical protein J2X36_003945 [Methylobacterium sp. BE186]|uniref:hypothetical protein n=1 Tax=Methylobacterium sp. BE186 TaxID=2817715 RepID=UPI00285D84D6|nr:hypothetical protein [Methylobacterium sp. BE186]MDR7039172.1 hypothetical protein [Methylobacterium sp. BE186]